MEKMDLEKEKKIEEDNVFMLIVAQILVKVLGLIYRVVIVNVPGFRKCRKRTLCFRI